MRNCKELQSYSPKTFEGCTSLLWQRLWLSKWWYFAWPSRWEDKKTSHGPPSSLWLCAPAERANPDVDSIALRHQIIIAQMWNGTQSPLQGQVNWGQEGCMFWLKWLRQIRRQGGLSFVWGSTSKTRFQRLLLGGLEGHFQQISSVLYRLLLFCDGFALSLCFPGTTLLLLRGEVVRRKLVSDPPCKAPHIHYFIGSSLEASRLVWFPCGMVDWDWRGGASSLRSHSLSAAEPGFACRAVWLQAASLYP